MSCRVAEQRIRALKKQLMLETDPDKIEILREQIDQAECYIEDNWKDEKREREQLTATGNEEER